MRRKIIILILLLGFASPLPAQDQPGTSPAGLSGPTSLFPGKKARRPFLKIGASVGVNHLGYLRRLKILQPISFDNCITSYLAQNRRFGLKWGGFIEVAFLRTLSFQQEINRVQSSEVNVHSTTCAFPHPGVFQSVRSTHNYGTIRYSQGLTSYSGFLWAHREGPVRFGLAFGIQLYLEDYEHHVPHLGIVYWQGSTTRLSPSLGAEFNYAWKYVEFGIRGRMSSGFHLPSVFVPWKHLDLAGNLGIYLF